MILSRAAFAISVCLLVSLCQVRSQELPQDESTEKAERWFDGLGYDLVRPLVLVSTGGWSRSGNDPAEKEFRCGFLQSADDAGFRVLFPDLTERSFKYEPPGTEELDRVYYEAADLKLFAEASLAAAKDPDRGAWSRFGERLSQRTEFFVLGRACALAGHRDLADELYAYTRSKLDKEETDLLDAIRQDMAYSRIWQLTLRCGSASEERTVLEADFAAFLKHFEGTRDFEKAKEIHDQLVVMVAEDAAHKSGVWEEMTTDQKVSELIYQVRDQNGEQWSQPGECDIFFDPRGEKSPAHRLVEMGFDAVPQLIEVIDDQRLTRSVGFHRNFYFSHYVLRVGDCAIAILSEISGRSFYERTYTNGYPLKDGQGSAIKQEAAAWWADVKKRGIEAVLAEGVEKGDRSSAAQALQLAAKDPKRALEAIQKGVAAAESEWVQQSLITVAGGLGQELAGEFVVAQLTAGANLGSRLAAARILHGWGDPKAVPAMIGEWEQQTLKLGGEGRLGVEELIRFLFASRDADAARAVAEVVAGLTIQERREVVDEASDLAYDGLPLKGEFANVGEEMLIKLLDDTDRVGGSGIHGGWAYSNARMCEFALLSLGHLWPDKYPEMPATGRFARAMQFNRAKNTWRETRGMEALPEPTNPEPVPADEEVMNKLWATAAGDKPGNSVKEIEALGLSALAFVSANLVGKDADDANWAPLFALERRLSLIVRDVEFDANDVSGSDGLEAALVATKGKPLDTLTLEHLLDVSIKELPAGAKGFSFDAWRDDDGCGVTIAVKLEPGRQTGKGWRYSEVARLRGKGLLASGGVCVDSVLREEGAFKQLGKAMEQIVAGGPRDFFEVIVGVNSD